MHDPSGDATACRILHVATPASELAPPPIPAKFEEMETWWRATGPVRIADLETHARRAAASGLTDVAATLREVARRSTTPDPTSRKPFVHPARAMRLVPVLTLPDQSPLEFAEDPKLRALLEDERAASLDDRLATNDIGPFTTDPDDARVTQPWLTHEGAMREFG